MSEEHIYLSCIQGDAKFRIFADESLNFSQKNPV